MPDYIVEFYEEQRSVGRTSISGKFRAIKVTTDDTKLIPLLLRKMGYKPNKISKIYPEKKKGDQK